MQVTGKSGSRIGRAVRAVVGTIGAGFIYLLIYIFGRVHEEKDIPWLAGPLGGDHIGDRPYQETAEAENLTLERDATAGGLIPDFSILASDSFDVDAVDERIREFYEGTAGYTFDTWAKTYFPANIALWLLVQTISRRVDQLNFPLEGLETAHGMTSEIVLLRERSGKLKYTGWFRGLRKSGRAIYTGFYMTRALPPRPDGTTGAECVKVVFPMPGGSATVLLRPENDPDGGFRLDSKGRFFGDVGFYRVQRAGEGRVRVWRIRSLHERFRLYVDHDGVVRCEHKVSFLGMPVVSLHYRLSGEASRAPVMATPATSSSTPP